MQGITIEELKTALSQLPADVQQELHGPPEVDSVSVKMELIKFVTELHKHNQGVDWETNKIKPKKITFHEIIEDSQNLYKFVTD